MLANWMKILDYNTENKETPDKTFDLLLSSLHLFGIKSDMQKDELIIFKKEYLYLKNINEGNRKHSFSLYAEAVNNVYNQMYLQ